MGQKSNIKAGWCFGCHELYFPINIGLLIIPIDELIFFRLGWPKTTKQFWWMTMNHIHHSDSTQVLKYRLSFPPQWVAMTRWHLAWWLPWYHVMAQYSRGWDTRDTRDPTAGCFLPFGESRNRMDHDLDESLPCGKTWRKTRTHVGKTWRKTSHQCSSSYMFHILLLIYESRQVPSKITPSFFGEIHVQIFLDPTRSFETWQALSAQIPGPSQCLHGWFLLAFSRKTIYKLVGLAGVLHLC